MAIEIVGDESLDWIPQNRHEMIGRMESLMSDLIERKVPDNTVPSHREEIQEILSSESQELV
jgi:hypothetical protein